MELTLYHGGRNLESGYKDHYPSKSGDWEHGPGLYLTNQYDTAYKYAKGGGSVYKVTIDFDPSKSMGEPIVKLEDAIAFVKQNAKASKRRDVIESLEENAERRGARGLPVEVVNNLLLNYEALAPAKTVALAEFLVDHGVQYAATRYGGRDETVVVVIDRRIIKKVEKTRAKDISVDDFVIPTPKINSRSGFSGSATESTEFSMLKNMLRL